jgi:hypothetical protein
MKILIATLFLALTLAAQTARDATEFTLFKRADPIKVGDIGLILKSTDVNKQRYNVIIIVDDHRIERKDMDIKVPFYVYVGANTAPHELVVTKVAQDQIVGRLVSPK